MWLSEPGYEVFPGLPDLIEEARATDVGAFRVWKLDDHRPAVIVREPSVSRFDIL